MNTATNAAQPAQLSPERVEEIRVEFEAWAMSLVLKSRHNAWMGYLAASTAREADRVDAERWRDLRSGPDPRIDYRTPGIPWAVCVAIEHGIPTTKAISGPALDVAIDAARAQKETK